MSNEQNIVPIEEIQSLAQLNDTDLIVLGRGVDARVISWGNMKSQLPTKEELVLGKGTKSFEGLSNDTYTDVVFSVPITVPYLVVIQGSFRDKPNVIHNDLTITTYNIKSTGFSYSITAETATGITGFDVKWMLLKF